MIFEGEIQKKIKIVEVGEIQPNIAEILTKNLNRRFKNKFYFGGRVKIPSNSHNKFKNQYNTETLLEYLEGHKEKGEKIIGLTSKDIYSKDLNFLFSACSGEVSLVSTARLDPEFYGEPKNFEKLVERTKKEMIGMLGLMFGLKKCGESSCVMAPAKSVSYLDDKKDDFCNNCHIKISMEDIRI